jgi:hypothetical protein
MFESNTNPDKAREAVYQYLLHNGPTDKSMSEIGYNICFSHGAVDTAIEQLVEQGKVTVIKLSTRRYVYMALPICKRKYLPRLNAILADDERRMAHYARLYEQYKTGLAHLKDAIKMVEAGDRADQLIRELGYE